MSILTSEKSIPKYGINPPPTEAELALAKKIVVEAKIRAKLNRAKTPKEARAKFEKVREEIREFVNNRDN